MFTVAILFVIVPAIAVTLGSCKLALVVKRAIVG